MTSSFRIERDSMGELQVPADALWGAQTQRAVQNFPISGHRLPRAFIRALALVKQAAARANTRLELLDANIALGYVRREANQIGTELTLQTLDGKSPVKIVELPFVAK